VLTGAPVAVWPASPKSAFATFACSAFHILIAKAQFAVNILCSMIKHRYAHEIDPNGGSAAARLGRMVEPGQRVLELGTGPGTVTRILHSKGCKVTGVEMDSETLAMCAPFCERTLQANLEDPAWHASLAGEKFDVVMCADVLEHLRDPRPLLSLLPTFLNDTGCVLMSLPNATHLSVVASLMAGRFPYQSKGLLDNTHLRFFGRDDIDALLRECGLVWQRWETVQLDPSEAELKHFWNKLEPFDQEFLRAKCEDGLVYQHVVRSYPSHAAGQLIKLQKDIEDEELLIQEKSEALNSVITSLNELTQAHAAAMQVWAEEKTQMNQRADQLTEALEKSQATLAWTEDQLKNHQDSLREVLSSASWKITKPFRAFKR
jgi:2-polyprenyl-3-methyl-5-hydroxy-6-metoxy-1,4-benzoquinol methylase